MQEPTRLLFKLENNMTTSNNDIQKTTLKPVNRDGGDEINSAHPTVLRLKKKETGLGRNLMTSIVQRHKNDPIRQIGEFFETFQIPSATGRARTASIATTKAYRERMTIVTRKLRELNMAAQNLDEISAKQIRHVFKRMETEGWSVSWLANINTTVRRFGIWICKPDLCPPLKDLVSTPSAAVRQQTAMVPKDWHQVGVDAERAICLVQVNCPTTALQLRLARAFGVRVQEFLMFKPLQAQKAAGFIYIKDGAKGGRPRLVPIENDEQRALLSQATELAEKHPRGLVMAKDWMTLRQAINHFYYQLRRAGINKQCFGVTAHGLRHGYACTVYNHLTGEAAPVMGGGLVDAALDHSARMEIAERLGHGRKNVTSAYLGSHRMLSRSKRNYLQDLAEILESDPVLKEVASAAGLEGFYVVGAAAAGNPVGRGQLMSFAYRAQKRFDETQAQADRRVAMDAMDMAMRAGQLLDVQAAVVPMSNIVDTVEQYELVGITLKGGATPNAGSTDASAMTTGD